MINKTLAIHLSVWPLCMTHMPLTFGLLHGNLFSVISTFLPPPSPMGVPPPSPRVGMEPNLPLYQWSSHQSWCLETSVAYGASDESSIKPRSEKKSATQLGGAFKYLRCIGALLPNLFPYPPTPSLQEEMDQQKKINIYLSYVPVWFVIDSIQMFKFAEQEIVFSRSPDEDCNEIYMSKW